MGETFSPSALYNEEFSAISGRIFSASFSFSKSSSSILRDIPQEADMRHAERLSGGLPEKPKTTQIFFGGNGIMSRFKRHCIVNTGSHKNTSKKIIVIYYIKNNIFVINGKNQ